MKDKNFITLLAEFEEKIHNYHMPRFDELPDLGLYMDQVIGYINKVLNVFDEAQPNLITPSMINNYVKHGIMPAPKGKKYENTHLAYLCVIYFLKQVWSMDEIKSAVFHQTIIGNDHNAYTCFCTEFENALKNCCVLIKENCNEMQELPDESQLLLKRVTASIANLFYSQKILAIHALLDAETKKGKVAQEKIEKENEKQKEKFLKEEKKKEKNKKNK